MRLIDAEPLLKAVKENKELYERERLYLEGLLLNAPTVDLTKNQAYDKGFITAMKLYARPQGKWIHRRIITKDRSFDMVVCSNCQTEFSWDAETGVSMDNYNTCPNCGADMRGKEE